MGGACKSCNHEACQPYTDIVKVKSVRKVKAGTKIAVISETYDYGYGIILERFKGKMEIIER